MKEKNGNYVRFEPLAVETTEAGSVLQPPLKPQQGRGERSPWHYAHLASKICVVLGIVLFVMSTGLLFVAWLNTFSDGNGDVSFFVIGDWGREGTTNQSMVAQLMGHVGTLTMPEFVVSTGDNFYPNGLNSTADSLFNKSFASVYTAMSLQLPWYAVLGNHDYGDGKKYCENDEKKTDCPRSPRFQLGTRLGEENGDERWYCERQYSRIFGADKNVQVFFVDTPPMIQDYSSEDWAKYDAGILQQSWESQLAELDSNLQISNAKWKIVVGHHPPRSNGHHGNNTDLMIHLEPVLQRNGVLVYFAGHDHSLEHMFWEDVNMHYIVSGAGSDCKRGFLGKTASLYQFMSSGFVHVAVRGSAMDVGFYTVEGGPTPAYSTVIRLP